MDGLTQADIVAILASLEPIPQIEGYWIDEFLAVLSARFPHQVADFFMNRVERAAAAESYQFRAVNHGPWSHRRLRFLETDEGLRVLRHVWAWLAANQARNSYFRHAAVDMFDAMFLHELDAVVQLFGPASQTAPPGELKLIASLFRRAHHSFAFTQSDFVVRFLTRCAEVDPDLAKSAASDFFGSAISGVRTGAVGEASPQDLEQLAKAKEVLGGLSLASPAYDLYDWIRGAAENEIARSRAEGEARADG
jgi:hypothetical protein